jgi:hypothetical protein
MKRIRLLVVLAMLLSVAEVEGRNRGHGGASGMAPFRQPGAVIGPGVGQYGFPGQRAFGFGPGRRGFSARRSWPPFGWGLGGYYSETYAPPQSRDSDAAFDSDGEDSPNIYYYQKPAESGVKPNCADSWTRNDSSSSLSNFMNKVFELQCQNRHPEVEPKPSPAPPSDKN